MTLHYCGATEGCIYEANHKGECYVPPREEEES